VSHPLLPEVLLLLLIFVLAALDAWLWPRRQGRGFAHAGFLGLLLPLTAALAMWGTRAASGLPWLAIDPYYETWRVLLLTIGVLVAALDAGRRSESDDGAETTLLLIAVGGGLLVVAARHLVLVYAGLEITGLALLARSVRQGQLPLPPLSRWLIAHALGSAMLLVGVAILATGGDGVAFDGLRHLVPASSTSSGAILLLIGVCLRAGCVPFHGWLAPLARRPGHELTHVLALGVLPAVAVLARLVADPLVAFETLRPMLIILGLLSVTVGNLLGLVQRDLRRLLAFALMIHVGYSLMAIGSLSGSEAHLLHIVVAALALVGLAAATEFRAEQITAAGLAARRPVLAAAVCVCLLALAGVPPLLGYAARTRLLTDLATFDEGVFLLACVNVAVTAWVFVAASGRVLFAPRAPQPAPPARPERTAVLVLAAGMLVLMGLWPAPLADLMAACDILP
jgi:NADH-quinone oxidoreductase subunit N